MELRPFQKEDWGVLLDLADLAVPFAPEDNEEWLEYRKAFDESERNRRHYIATDGGVPVGYGCLEDKGSIPSSFESLSYVARKACLARSATVCTKDC